MRHFVSAFSLFELLLAIFLSAIICVGIFHIFMTIENLQQHQIKLSQVQQSIRFVNTFLREKIQAAGDWSCLKKSPGSRSISVRGYTSDEAYDKLGLTIISDTDLLQLHECIRLHDHFHYLPVEFFMADTFRVNAKGQDINALFFKIEHHPRQELITDMTDFQLQFGLWDKIKKNIRSYHTPHDSLHYKNVGAIKIHYTISSLPGMLYVALRKK